MSENRTRPTPAKRDADTVARLTRSEYYAQSEEEKEKLLGQAELIIAKQRNGPVGEVKLTFLKEFTRFEDRAEERDAALSTTLTRLPYSE